VLGLTAFQAAVIAAPWLVTGSFHNETRASYALFHAQLDSLHRYGEPAWWSPQLGWGVPGYAAGLLGLGGLGRPAFVSLGMVAWILGRVGIPLPPVHWLYVFHAGVLIPLLLLLGVRLLGREVFRSRTAMLYALVVAAFSPATLFALEAPGIVENTAYALLCSAAFLRFAARPDVARRRTLCASLLLLCVAANASLLVSAVPLLASVVAAGLAISPGARAAVRSVRPAEAAVAIGLLVAMLAPAAIAHLQVRDQMTATVAPSLGGESFGDFGWSPGPADALDPSRVRRAASPTHLRVLPLRAEDGFGRLYLGVATVPLACVGLAVALRRGRRGRFVGLLLAGAALALLAAKPTLATLLLGLPGPVALGPPFDVAYRGFAWLVLVLAAGRGLEVVERRRETLRPLLFAFLACSVPALLAWLVWMRPPPTAGGFAAFMAAAIAVVWLRAARLPHRARVRLLRRGLLALLLLDVSTAALWHVRPILHARSLVTDAPLDAKGRAASAHDLTTEVPVLRATAEWAEARVEVDRLPFAAGFCAAHADTGPSRAGRGENEWVARRSLPLPETLRTAAAVAPFFAAAAEPCDVDVEVVARSYDSLRLSVESAQPALVFVRNSWSDGWTATVDGAPTPVLRALGAFQAVAAPTGASSVELVFSPRWVGAALLVAYALLVAVALRAVAERGAAVSCGGSAAS